MPSPSLFSLPPPPSFFPVCVIHWSRQIKQVLNVHTSVGGDSDQAGPLAEVEHWKNRCADLSGITSQLDLPAVLRIIKCLKIAKSNYISPFLKLSGQIQVGGQVCAGC